MPPSPSDASVPTEAGSTEYLPPARVPAERLAFEAGIPRRTAAELQAQCQCIWQTDITMVCTMPKGHEGDHRSDFGWSWNGPVSRLPPEPDAVPIEVAGKLTIAIERGGYVLAQMMQAYERRIRSDCTSQEQIDKRPWECAEYLAAAHYLRVMFPQQPETKEGGL